jgi:D-3-phosphoglycerate dehydrogenase
MRPDLKKYRVLVTPTTFGLHDQRLCQELEAIVGEVIYNRRGRPLSSSELQELLPGCDGFIAGLDHVDRMALESTDRLKVIARYGVGIDNIDMETAARKKIIVTNTPHANAVSVAELTIALLLSLARSIPQVTAFVRDGEWPRLQGTVLAGKIIGLIGLGAVGMEVAHRLQAWQATLLAYDPFPDRDRALSLKVRLVELEVLIRRADFLSLHAPLLDATRHMVNADFLSRVKPGAYLINTARGEIVDEPALLDALNSGQLGGAALDVYSEEPPAANSPLRRHPRVIATPHCGAHTDHSTTVSLFSAEKILFTRFS